MARTAAFDRTVALERAMNLFWAGGYHATSLKDIEAALDMRPGSIYAAFGSKEALFREALAFYGQTTRGALKATLDRSASPLAGLATHVRNIGRQAGDTVPSKACMLMKTVLETPDDDPVLRAGAEDLMRQVEGTFAEAFESARDMGQISRNVDVQHLAARLQSEIMGLRAYAQRSDASERVPALADDIARNIEDLTLDDKSEKINL